MPDGKTATGSGATRRAFRGTTPRTPRRSPRLLRVTGVMHNDQSRGPRASQHSPGEPGTLPAVSVVMPVLNEERHLAESVAAVLGQEYPGGFELVLAIGPSKDRTEAIARALAAVDSRITVVPNPSGQIATAMTATSKTMEMTERPVERSLENSTPASSNTTAPTASSSSG